MTEGLYLAELIFRIHDSDRPGLYQFDKQMRIIEAGSVREAYQNTLVLASQELDKHNIRTNLKTQWEFAGIALLENIDAPGREDITSLELHYTIETSYAAKEYLQELKEKNALLQNLIALSA